MLHFIAHYAEFVLPEIGMLAVGALAFAFPPTRALAHRAARTARSLARRDSGLPRWARYGFVLACMPVPGPFDEIVGGLLAFALLRGKHAATVRAAWRSTVN